MPKIPLSKKMMTYDMCLIAVKVDNRVRLSVTEEFKTPELPKTAGQDK
ncbi:MAG: hypothetical protein M0012_07285 [Deltaproteobacteria bacterium]|nr:hypothetical protein [Deltaproteobacteria bacterium]